MNMENETEISWHIPSSVGYIREKAKLSQYDLSKKIDKSDYYIRLVESWELAPSLETLLEIINACGSTVEEFFHVPIKEYKPFEFLKIASRERKELALKFLNIE